MLVAISGNTGHAPIKMERNLLAHSGVSVKFGVIAMLLATIILSVSSYTAYPAFGDRSGVQPPAATSQPRVEATTDRGPIVEMIVRCPKGTAIISYSKVERLYCSPKHACNRSLGTVLARTCG
jgi:hypothetical protein